MWTHLLRVSAGTMHNTGAAGDALTVGTRRGEWLAAQCFSGGGARFFSRAVEYLGYEFAAGQGPSEVGIYAGAEVALEHLHQNVGVPRERTVLVLRGQSLGLGVMVEIAKRGFNPKALAATGGAVSRC